MRPMQRTATGDLRRLREDLRAKLSGFGRSRNAAIDSAPPNRSDQDHPANRLVSSSTRPARDERPCRDRSDCRGLDAALGDCGQRLSPPCVGWGTAVCRRNARGVALMADHLGNTT